MVDSSDDDENRPRGPEEWEGSRVRTLNHPARRPVQPPPSYDDATLPPYPNDHRFYVIRTSDRDMTPVVRTPEQTANQLQSMGFQVFPSPQERELLQGLGTQDRAAHAPPNYELSDPNNGAVFTIRPVQAYGYGGTYNGLDYRPNVERRPGEQEFGVAIHRRIHLSAENISELSARHALPADLNLMLQRQEAMAGLEQMVRAQSPVDNPPEHSRPSGTAEAPERTPLRSQEGAEQFAQPRNDYEPQSPDFLRTPSPIPGPLDAAGRLSPLPGRNRSLSGGSRHLPEPPRGNSPLLPSRPDSLAGSPIPSGPQLTAEQQEFQANWSHDRQPTFDEMDGMIAGSRTSSPAVFESGSQPAGEPVSRRPLKRRRSSDDLSGDEGGPSSQPPARRPRLMPRSQRVPSEDGTEGGPRARNLQDRQQPRNENSVRLGNSIRRDPTAERQRERNFDDAERQLRRSERDR